MPAQPDGVSFLVAMNATTFIDDACQLLQEARNAQESLEFETAYRRYEKCLSHFQQVVLLLREEGGKSVIEDQMKIITQNMHKIRRYVDNNAIKLSENLVAPAIKADSMRMRNKAAEEVRATEASYVQSLQFLSIAFVEPLRFQAQTAVPVLPAQDVAELFDTVKPVMDVHEALLAILEKRFEEEWAANDCLGDIFIKFCPDLRKALEGYSVGYERVTTRVNELKESNERFRMFLECIQQDNKQGLLDILIMPVQRMMRYILLLDALRKHTPKGHRDYAQLEQALKQFKEMAALINKSVSASGSTIRVESLFKRSLELHDSQRLIKEGMLQKIDRHGQTVSKHFFLFTGLVVYAQMNKETRKFSSRTRRAVVSAHQMPEVNASAFQLRCRNKTFTLLATTPKECQEWVKAVEEATRK